MSKYNLSLLLLFFGVCACDTKAIDEKRRLLEAKRQELELAKKNISYDQAYECLKSTANHWHNGEITQDPSGKYVVYAFQVRKEIETGKWAVLDLDKTLPPNDFGEPGGAIDWSATIQNRSPEKISGLAVRFMIFDVSPNDCRNLGEVLAWADVGRDLYQNHTAQVKFTSEYKDSPQTLPPKREGYERVILAIFQ